MEMITKIIALFKEFFAALKAFLMGLKQDKIDAISKVGDALGGITAE